MKQEIQAGSILDIAFASSHTIVCNNDAAIQSLAISLRVVVFRVLPDNETKMFLSKGNDFVQTFIAR